MDVIQKDGSIIGFAKIEHSSDEILSRLDRKEWCLPFIADKPEHRRCEWLTVRLLVKQLLGEEKQILYRPNGKPYIVDDSHYVSISHSKNYVVVILNSQHEVAIDIERISPRVVGIAPRFMNDLETAAIPVERQIEYMLLHWSAKESVFKMMNESGVDFREDIRITPFNPVFGEWGTFEASETKSLLKQKYKIHYLVTENAALTAIT